MMDTGLYALAWVHGIGQILGLGATMGAFGMIIGRAGSEHPWYELVLLPSFFCMGTALEGFVFMAGARWDFDPRRYPKVYCHAASISFNLGAYLMSVCGVTFSLTTLQALRETSRGNYELIRRPWRVPAKYVPLFFLYPVAGCVAFSTLALHFDAIGPEGIWICDIARPGYMSLRLLGYGGLDTLATVPATIASILSIRLLYHIHIDAQRREDMKRYDAPVNTGVYNPDVRRAPKPKEVVTSLLPSLAQPFPQPEATLKITDHVVEQPPMIAGLRVQLEASRRQAAAAAGQLDKPSHWSPAKSDDLSLHSWPEKAKTSNGGMMRTVRTTWMIDNERVSPNPGDRPPHVKGEKLSIGRIVKAARDQPELMVACYRIMLFDVMFTVVQILAAGSTLHAVATGVPPPGYTTAYVAAFLASWGPACVFGSNPAVLDKIFPYWRRLLNRLERW